MNSKPFGFNEFISRNEDSKISSRIKEELLKNLEYFDSKTKFHLLSRLHSAYPGKGYSFRIQEIIPDLEKNLKDRLSKCLLEKNPSSSLEGINLYTNLCNSYFPLGRNNLMYLIDSDLLESALKYLRKHFYTVMEKMLSEEKIIIGLPASAPRNLYYAKSSNLIEDNDILHLEKLLLDSSKKMYTEEKLKDKKIFDNYIYFLTHVILGELNFYTSKLLDPSPGIKEMIDYLEKNSERIIKECSWDKVVEAGVCLKYCGRSSEVYKKAIKKILNKRGIIGYGGPFEEKKDLSYREEMIQQEHSNVLAVLLFSDKN